MMLCDFGHCLKLLFIILYTFNKLELIYCRQLPSVDSQFHLEDLHRKLDALLQKRDPYLIPSNCVDVLAHHNESGIYGIYIATMGVHPVYCMADPDGGLPWLIIQRRVDGNEDFYRNWTDYRDGFGNLNRNFFIGLEKLHLLTTQDEPQELWVQLRDADMVAAYAHYEEFAIGDETENYALNVLGKYSGSAGNSLGVHCGMMFSTFDNDNDLASGNCARFYKGAWWYRKCHDSNLNGVWGSSEKGKGVNWIHFREPTMSMDYAHMAIRPVRP